ncbi:hypothetical protein CLOM_g7576 [Closterium sp. NIES-68]|nr:hypothetical protein CLOM_g7576 [Closterium sp. NIES-68]GJP71062.1 hypothetical protein CLOP_g1927 [Closterium sp. NIES-67]
MAVDRTEDYRDAVKSLAVRLGYDQARLAQVTSAMMLKPTSGGGEASTKDAFARLASDVLSDERSLHSLLMAEGREYCNAASDHVVGHGAMERRRDAFEAKVGGMVKDCREGIEALRGRLPPPGGATGRNAQMTAHQHGIVLILTEHLQLLSSTFERLRATRLQRMLAESKGQRQGGGLKEAGKGARIQALKGIQEKGGGQAWGGRGWENGEGGKEERQAGRGKEEQQQVVHDPETLALQEELADLLSSTAQTEARVMELAALNHLFAVHVMQQSEQIQQLYAEAVAASERIDKGNKELKKAAAHGSSHRTFLILFFFVLPLSLLFYDWYDRRQVGFRLW